jgi:iron complex outermembrane receptor protein
MSDTMFNTIAASPRLSAATTDRRRRRARQHTGCAVLVLAAVLWGTAAPMQAQTRPIDLATVTLEDLMNIEITSASRKEQRAEDVPAAVYVITREDIRRSGMKSVPELLRLVPGVQVAQINANKWAVSVRGFNNLQSNKLLVLVDGRSIYNPLFASVLWDTEDLMLEDVDRIEVIRGAGGAVWGANAVNGVINIITRSAADTPGLLVRAGGGTFDRSDVAVRYGGTSGRGAYRTYAQISTHGNSALSSQTDANDHWRSATSGFRGDWSTGVDAFMLQGGVAAGEERPLWLDLDPALNAQTNHDGVSQTQVADALGRWTHTRSTGATLQLQSFVDVEHRHEAIGTYQRRTLDLDAVYHMAIGGRNDLVAGGGYRYIYETMGGGFGYSFTPDRAHEHLLNVFAQDAIALAGKRLELTLGAKFEQDTGIGLSLQPTARLMWHLMPAQHLWGAVSRAVRTPSLVDRGVHIDLPPVIQPAQPGDPTSGFPIAVTVLGNPAVQNERLINTEAGYRIDIGSRAAIDVAAFIGRYQGIQTAEPGAPSVAFVGGRPVIAVSTLTANLLDADTRGVEISGRARLASAWQLDGSLSTFHYTRHLDPASHDPLAAAADGDAPAYQWRGHSAMSFGSRAQADLLVFYVGSLGRLAIPAYTRADARFEWKVTSRLSATIQGQNMFSAAHPEFLMDLTTIVSTQMPRSARFGLTWR